MISLFVLVDQTVLVCHEADVSFIDHALGSSAGHWLLLATVRLYQNAF